MSMQTPGPDQARAQQNTTNDVLIPERRLEWTQPRRHLRGWQPELMEAWRVLDSRRGEAWSRTSQPR